MTPIPAQIRVTVRGPRSTLDDLHADDISSVQVDVRGGNETRVVFDPSIDPGAAGAQGRADRSAGDRPAVGGPSSCATSPCEVGVVGTPAAGFMVKGAPVAEPAFVRAHGPKSEVMRHPARARRRVRRHGADGGQVHAAAGDRPAAGARDVRRAERERDGRDRARGGGAALHEGARRRRRARERQGAAGRGRRPPRRARRRSCARCGPSRSSRASRLQPTTEHGSDALPVQLVIDQCEVHVTPPSVIVRW